MPFLLKLLFPEACFVFYADFCFQTVSKMNLIPHCVSFTFLLIRKTYGLFTLQIFFLATTLHIKTGIIALNTVRLVDL